MEPSFSIRRHKTLFLMALFLLGFVFRVGSGMAAGTEQADEARQIEAVVVHVDQFAVYAPNLIFYFDARMDKRKIASITRMANQLRNRKAVISYWGSDTPGPDKRFVLIDVVPAGEKPEMKNPPREASVPAVEVQAKQGGNLPKEEATPPVAKPVEKQAVPALAYPREKKPPEKTGQSAPITKNDLTAFVRNLLELNGRKDLPAAISFYGDKVNYYDRGVVDRDYIRRDLGYYYRNWDTISTSLDGDIVMIVLDPDVRIAKFIVSYSVKNARKSLTGKTENIWKIERINGQLKLVDVKRKTTPGEPSGH